MSHFQIKRELQDKIAELRKAIRECEADASNPSLSAAYRKSRCESSKRLSLTLERKEKELAQL